MKLSQKGIDFIVSFEGKHRALGDGRYIAYKCPAGVWTIHAGVTEGVKPGMIVTEAEGQAMFARELAHFEQAVERLVTVPLNQNEFDCLVSFAYNCGEGALARSSILKNLNAGNREAAARGFAAWNRGGGRVLPGLVRRRAAEASLFRQLVTPAADPEMPQRIDPPPAKPEGSRIATTATAGETAAGGMAIGGLGLSFAEALGYGGQIVPLVKTYGLALFIGTMLAIAAGFYCVRYWRREDHETGKTAP
jgi:lysozyme